MPNWVRHIDQTVSNPGFWTAKTTNVIKDNCTLAQQAAVIAAFKSLTSRSGMNAFPGLKAAIVSVVDGIKIDCCFDATRPPRDDEPQPSVFVCGETGDALEALLCKGAVDVSMGTLLDARAMQFACFGAPLGAPTTADVQTMASLPTFGGNPNERDGKFVIWNRTTGQVFDKTPGTGGFWTGSGPTRGAVGFSAPDWIR